jgi:hypothetical protein
MPTTLSLVRMKNQISLIFCLVLVLSASNGGIAQTPRLFINELVALEHRMISDPRGEFDDWIEIYNDEDTAVCIAGFYVTDNFSKPKKAKVDGVFKQFTTIPPKGHLVLWLDKGTKVSPPIHLPLKLNGEGEEVAIYSPNGVLIDSVSFGPQKTGFSYARLGDGQPGWGFANKHTPGEKNTKQRAVFTPLPVFNLAHGFYDNSVVVSLSGAEKEDTIRYTLDGNRPTKNTGIIFKAPFKIEATSAVRAGIFSEGKHTDSIAAHTYFIRTEHSLPVFSLSTDSVETLLRTGDGDFYKGENRAQIEFFEQNESVFTINAGFRLLGLAIRYFPQKSIGLKLRTEYGNSTLNYPLFAQKPYINKIHGFALRNSGNDNTRTLFRDGLMHSLISTGTSIDYLSYSTTVLYINGRYWGIYNLREKVSSQYIKENHPKNGKSIDLLEWKGAPIEGDDEAFNAMWQYFESTDLSIAENYVHATSMIDLQNFIDYHIGQTFYGNTDWPMANIKYWKSRKGKGKWRWVLFDTDLAFELNKNKCPGHHNSIKYILGENNCHLTHLDHALTESTTIFRSLIKNESFKERFLSRYIDLLNVNFKSENVLTVIDSLQDKLAVEMPQHINRWSAHSGIRSMSQWENEVDMLRQFASERPDSIRQFLSEAFNLGNSMTVNISVNNAAGGTILVNSISPTQFPFEAVFFEKLKFRLFAIPKPGWVFKGWQELETESNRIETLPLLPKYTAIFEQE